MRGGSAIAGLNHVAGYALSFDGISSKFLGGLLVSYIPCLRTPSYVSVHCPAGPISKFCFHNYKHNREPKTINGGAHFCARFPSMKSIFCALYLKNFACGALSSVMLEGGLSFES